MLSMTFCYFILFFYLNKKCIYDDSSGCYCSQSSPNPHNETKVDRSKDFDINGTHLAILTIFVASKIFITVLQIIFKRILVFVVLLFFFSFLLFIIIQWYIRNNCVSFIIVWINFVLFQQRKHVFIFYLKTICSLMGKL